MNIIIPTATGALKMTDIGNNISYDREMFPGKRISHFKFVELEGKQHTVIVRSDDVVQLYKSEGGMIKEWKNCNLHKKDRIVDITIIRNQYLCSCSTEGVFVVRDLINDDSALSYKKYLLQAPISAVLVEARDDIIRVYVSGKSNELKLYCINMVPREVYTESHEPQLYNINHTNIGCINELRFLLRRKCEIFIKDKLLPTWVSLYPGDNWIIAIKTWKNFILCGTQYGEIIFFDATDPDNPSKVLQKSNFPISNMQVFSNLLVYNDLISKIGIIDLHKLEQVHGFEFKFGPVEHTKLLYNKSKGGPILMATSNIDGKFTVLKLHNNGNVEVVQDLNLGYTVSCFSLRSHWL